MANTVEIEIRADPKNAEAGFRKTQGAFGRMADSIKRHRKAIGIGLTAVGAGITALSISAVKSAQAEAIGIQQLDVALQNVGTSYDAQAAAIEKVIVAQQDKTNFGDEVQREALMGLISVSGDYESAMAALPAVLDLAAGKGMELGAAATLVARAISGETSALKRYGIEVEKGAGSTEVIAAIMAKFGGQAEAAADPVTQLKNRIGDLQQEFGRILLPMLTTVAGVLERVTKRMIEWSEAHPDLTRFLGIAVAAIGGLMLVLGPLLIALPAITAGLGALGVAFAVATGPIGLIVAAIVGLVLAAKAFGADWGQIWEGIKAVVAAPVIIITNAINGIGDAISGIMDKLPGLSGLFGDSTESVTAFGDAIALTSKELEGLNLEQLRSRLIKLEDAELAAWEALNEAKIDSVGEAFQHLGKQLFGVETKVVKARKAFEATQEAVSDTQAAIKDLGNGYELTASQIAETSRIQETARDGVADKELAVTNKLTSLLQRQVNDQIAGRKAIVEGWREQSLELERIRAESNAAQEARETQITEHMASLLQRQMNDQIAARKAIVVGWREQSAILQSDLEAAANERLASEKRESDKRIQNAEREANRKIAALQAQHEAQRALTRRIAPAGIRAGRAPRTLAVLQNLINAHESAIRGARATGVDVSQGIINKLQNLLSERMTWFGFKSGGIVPGPMGQPKPAVVHGGEGIFTPQQMKAGNGMTVNLVINGDINGMDDFEAKVTSVIRDAVLGGGFSGVLARA